MRELTEFLPEEFRLLYRQFFLRIVDLEALSAQSDLVGYLGQFAGVFIMLSLIHALAAYIYVSGGIQLSFAWHMEQYLIKTMMLVTGLFAILTWDATFPDKRDIYVLSPLPVRSHTILLAKLAASGFVITLLIATLNIGSGLAWPLVLGLPLGGWIGVLRCMAAYWCTMVAASLFLFCSVLTVQGLIAMLLPRRPIPMDDCIAEALQAWRAQSHYRSDSDWVFASVNSGLDACHIVDNRSCGRSSVPLRSNLGSVAG